MQKTTEPDFASFSYQLAAVCRFAASNKVIACGAGPKSSYYMLALHGAQLGCIIASRRLNPRYCITVSRHLNSVVQSVTRGGMRSPPPPLRVFCFSFHRRGHCLLEPKMMNCVAVVEGCRRQLPCWLCGVLCRCSGTYHVRVGQQERLDTNSYVFFSRGFACMMCLYVP